MALNLSQNKSTTYSYVPKSERDNDTPFTINFRLLTLEEVAAIQDKVVLVHNSGSYNMNYSTQTVSILKLALTGWSNITNNNTPVIFEQGNLDSVALLPSAMRDEIASVILNSSIESTKVDEFIK